MKIYIYSKFTVKDFKISERRIRRTLEHIAQGTETTDLVAALYLSTKSIWTGGAAYANHWLYPKHFVPIRGKWARHAGPLPDDIPERYKLIRMLLVADSSRYPRREMDRYHWQHTYETFYDHLAHLFAHELHHFRRYHLGLHPREGENSANKWALAHVQKSGYQVTSRKIKMSKKKKRVGRQKPSLSKVFNPVDFGFDLAPTPLNTALAKITLSLSPKKQQKYINEKLAHFEKLHSLSPGSQLLITFDPSHIYAQQTATLVRPMRRNSVRIVIRTQDGKEWRWPMAWLERV